MAKQQITERVEGSLMKLLKMGVMACFIMLCGIGFLTFAFGVLVLIRASSGL